jgi:pimeloyl-ACP methyl ester carboxylesterase
MDIKHTFVEAQGLKLHIAQAGPETGPLVLLLHGFPESWMTWKDVMRPLAQAGFWVWAPDQRGYHLSDKPKGIASYRIEKLEADILALIHSAGRKKAFLVGHDWGGGVAWSLAARHPQVVEKLFVVNCPHPQVLLKNLVHNLTQIKKSWYMFFFQLPILPELYLRKNRFSSLVKIFEKKVYPAQDMAEYQEAWSQPGALEAMVNWYRAMRYPPGGQRLTKIGVPTMLVWGRQDPFLGEELAEASISLCASQGIPGKLEWIDDASHWVPREKPMELAQMMIRSFSASP